MGLFSLLSSLFYLLSSIFYQPASPAQTASPASPGQPSPSRNHQILHPKSRNSIIFCESVNESWFLIQKTKENRMSLKVFLKIAKNSGDYSLGVLTLVK